MSVSARLPSACMFVIGGLCGIATPTQAQVAPATISGILCDTQAQVRTIVSANQQSGDAMRAAFQQLNMQLNSANMPACSIQQVPHTMVSVPQSIDIGPWPENGQLLEAFVLHIQQNGFDGWFMYLAPQGFLNGTSNGPSNRI
jgi:hypothetical protein